MSNQENKVREYKVLFGFVKNTKGESAKIGSKIKLSDKFVRTHNLVNRGKVELYMTKKQKEEAEELAKQLAEENEE